jgi:hypothetical protein
MRNSPISKGCRARCQAGFQGGDNSVTPFREACRMRLRQFRKASGGGCSPAQEEIKHARGAVAAPLFFAKQRRTVTAQRKMARCIKLSITCVITVIA